MRSKCPSSMYVHDGFIFQRRAIMGMVSVVEQGEDRNEWFNITSILSLSVCLHLHGVLVTVRV